MNTVAGRLHITNGDSAAGALREAGIAGEIFAWRDVLHDGPVPAALTLEEMSEVRARFINECGWGELGDVSKEFRERDEKLRSFDRHDEVVLWFEHDLYDQLQLLQLLDWFSRHDSPAAAISLICRDGYLATLSSENITSLFGERSSLTGGQVQLGSEGWSAFCSPDPAELEAFAAKETSALPFVKSAFIRFLEEYPSIENGLSRNERQILEIARSGINSPARMFRRSQELEESHYLGDWSFWRYMGVLLEGDRPLLETDEGQPLAFPSGPGTRAVSSQQGVHLTDVGQQVLENELDWIELNGIDKWLGGVHLRDGEVWRWDGQNSRLVKGEA